MSGGAGDRKNGLVTTEDLRPLFTERSTARVHPGLAMHRLDDVPRLTLDSDAIDLLRDGLGFYDMEIRWLALLDKGDVLRLWRSWTGNQVYEAQVTLDPSGASAAFTSLEVEQHRDRYTGRLAEEPALFERIVISTINHLRYFRAGHTPYGPSPSAGPAPAPWPSPRSADAT